MSLGPGDLSRSLRLVKVALTATDLVPALSALLIDVFAILVLSEGVLDSIDDLLPAAALVATAVEKLIELTLVHLAIALALLDLLLELVDLLEVVTLLLVALGLLVGLDRLVELLVLQPRLLLLESLHLLLLLEQARLDLSHVLI